MKRREYVPWQQATLEAASQWYPEAKAAFEASKLFSEEVVSMTPEGQEAAAQLFSEERLRQGAFVWFTETLNRLWSYLSVGELVAYYYLGAFGWRPVRQEFWSTPEAENAIRSGYFSLIAGYRHPVYELRLLRSELNALFAKSDVKKKRFPRGKLFQPLVTALQECDKPRTPAREVVGALPQFALYRITERLWRAAEAAAGKRDPGRKPKKTTD